MVTGQFHFKIISVISETLLTIETSLVINYNFKAITNRNQRLWQTAFDLFADRRRKIRLSCTEGVCNHGENYVQVKLQIFPVSPACYTPKLGFFLAFFLSSVHYTRTIMIPLEEKVVIFLCLDFLLSWYQTVFLTVGRSSEILVLDAQP